LKDYWDEKDELCATGILELEIRIVKDALMCYEDAPSRKAPTSSENYKQENWIKLNFKQVKFQLNS
jgi:hypothetical protein